jgi:hypothetical protein
MNEENSYAEAIESAIVIGALISNDYGEEQAL